MLPVMTFASITAMLNEMYNDGNFLNGSGAGVNLSLFADDITPNPMTDYSTITVASFSGRSEIIGLHPNAPGILPDGRQGILISSSDVFFANAEPDPAITVFGYLLWNPNASYTQPLWARRFERPVPIHNGTVFSVEPIWLVLPTDLLPPDPLPPT